MRVRSRAKPLGSDRTLASALLDAASISEGNVGWARGKSLVAAGERFVGRWARFQHGESPMPKLVVSGATLMTMPKATTVLIRNFTRPL